MAPEHIDTARLHLPVYLNEESYYTNKCLKHITYNELTDIRLVDHDNNIAALHVSKKQKTK